MAADKSAAPGVEPAAPRDQEAPALTAVVNATLDFLYKHQHVLPSDATFGNLWEQLHAIGGCEECLKRWDGTTFRDAPAVCGASHHQLAEASTAVSPDPPVARLVLAQQQELNRLSATLRPQEKA